MSSAEARLLELGLELPSPPQPAGSYVEAVEHRRLIHLAGHGPVRADGSVITGKVGVDLSVEEGYEAARVTGLGLLATLKDTVGSLDRITHIIKVFGMVNAAPDFTQHPSVINGASDLMVDVFGDAGRHARSAVGMGSLPFQIAVEVEMIAAID